MQKRFGSARLDVFHYVHQFPSPLEAIFSDALPLVRDGKPIPVDLYYSCSCHGTLPWVRVKEGNDG